MRFLILAYSLMTLLPLAAQANADTVSCPMVKIEAERLADLNIPRESTLMLYLNGEITVIGGHTTNFVPTPTIEYYKDGKWHMVQSAYTHDDGFAVELTTGKVLIFGGHEKKLGIGQSFEAELYDPVTHTCEGFASLDTKRAIASALAMDSGRVVIAGNWYHEDAIEMYDGKKSFQHIKGTSVGRAYPFILRTAVDDAIIFGGMDSIGGRITSDVVDRLRGEPYHEPLLKEWHLICNYIRHPADFFFIGDESKGEYTYLLPLENDQGQIAIARVDNGKFSMLPTDIPVPMTCEWGRIYYYPMILADRQARRAYLVGCEADARNVKPDSRAFVLTIEYTVTPARLTLGYTDVINSFNPTYTIVTADGNLMIVGGNVIDTNFKPSGATWLLHVSNRAHAAERGKLWRFFPTWGWALIILVIAALAAGLALLLRRRSKKQGEQKSTEIAEEHESVTDTPEEADVKEALTGCEENDELMSSIYQVMEVQQSYLNPNLKISDIATMLRTNRTAISSCINLKHGCSFPQFVNTYRVKHAQKLLLSQPELKIAEVCLASGFSSEASFYRIFKAITGTTPSDWKRDNASPDPNSH